MTNGRESDEQSFDPQDSEDSEKPQRRDLSFTKEKLLATARRLDETLPWAQIDEMVKRHLGSEAAGSSSRRASVAARIGTISPITRWPIRSPQITMITAMFYQQILSEKTASLQAAVDRGPEREFERPEQKAIQLDKEVKDLEVTGEYRDRLGTSLETFATAHRFSERYIEVLGHMLSDNISANMEVRKRFEKVAGFMRIGSDEAVSQALLIVRRSEPTKPLMPAPESGGRLIIRRPPPKLA